MVTITDTQWLSELFEDEVCTECGWAEDKHTVGPDVFGLCHAYCTDPISEQLADDEADSELQRRIRLSTTVLA